MNEPGRIAAVSTVVITNSIKVAGLVIGVREMVTTRDYFVIGTCLVMMSGAQSLETVALRFIERFFGMEDK